MNDPISTAQVWRGTRQVGTLVQFPTETHFRYSDGYLPSELPGGGIASRLPGNVVTPGKALDPFFANLLPEGFRMEAIRTRKRIAAGDAYGLLLETGADTVGDVWVTETGTVPEPPEVRDLAQVSFSELFEADLAYPSSVQGVQLKISGARMSRTVRTHRAQILKLSPEQYPRLVENEAFILAMAKSCGIPVAKTKVVHDRDGVSGLLVERFDRLPDGSRLHQEDACQLCGVFPESKYDLTLRNALEAIQSVVASPDVAALRVLQVAAFSYLVGNNDLHLKNLSVVQTLPGNPLDISPAYDLVTALPYPKQTLSMALRMDAKSDNLRRRDFLEFFARFGLRVPTMAKALDRICDVSLGWIERFGEVGFEQSATERCQAVMRRRRDQIASV